MKVVVLGGSGAFGRSLLPQLAAQGLQATAVGRADGVDLTGVTSLRAALDDQLAGADVLVHAASDPRRAAAVDVAGTGKVVQHARRLGVRHLVFLSVVGCERSPLGYHRAKAAAEDIVRTSGVPYTIVRSTQWFHFVAQVAGTLARFGVAPRDWTVAPCDVAEVATLVTRRVLAPALDATVEIGGPQTVTLPRAVRDVGGHRVLHVGVPGRLSRAVRDGVLLPGPGAATASLAWGAWVARHQRDDN